ncbi:MAG: isoleucine--tRNA ligase [Candidatus Omnitrophota bacterium]|nr:isoleucine--tRNA ligase [Candidatus Omnitrophota bacterium]
MEYKNTLNLPKTKFSMKANLSVLEPKTLTAWEALHIYDFLLAERAEKPKFVLHDGPPYANGAIHIGHALNKVLKDIVLKYKTMRGYACPFITGWDCHGLPVEHQLFKELNLTKHDVNIAEFRTKAKNFALTFVKVQSDDFNHLGIFSDANAPYLTLQPEYEYSTIKLLEQLVRDGYIYRGRKPVNWCSSCETALAEAEVEYQDKESYSLFVGFTVTDAKGVFTEQNVSFLVWTTTPWTLVSNVAVAVHPELAYALISLNGKNFIAAEALLPTLEKKLSASFGVIKTFSGRSLEGIILAHPFIGREAPVVVASFVSHEDGSGCVHIAPGHGEEDFSLTRHYDLPVIMPVNDKGIFDEPNDFRGKTIAQANELVIEKLTSTDTIVSQGKMLHSYPHCWRCKNAVIFRATNQWFLKIDHRDLRSKLLDETGRVQWVPAGGKDRMVGMIKERPDWCLSRQRLWGVPIPAIRCRSCNTVMLSADVLSRVADIFRKQGSDSWFTLDIHEFLPQNFQCQACGNTQFTKEFDILDVWFESGASFRAVVMNRPQLQFPADMYLEGSDQHRGWFQASLIPAVATEGRAPFKTILTHGFVVDGEGKKMSKSLGNVIAPQEVTKKYGAEILRLWAASSDYREDVKISQGIINQLIDTYRKIRNTIRFIMGNLYDFNEAGDSPAYQELLEVDRYMLAKTTVLLEEAMAEYDDFQFYRVCQKIFIFCNLDLSSFYLDILKDRLYTFSPNSRERRSCQFVLSYILNVLLKVTAPVLPFTAEEAYAAWGEIPAKKQSIFATTFDTEHHADWKDTGLLTRWEKLFTIRDAVLKEIEKHREGGTIGSSLEAEITLTLDEAGYALCDRVRDALREVFIVSAVTLSRGVFGVDVKKSEGKKCSRCWNWKKTISDDQHFPGVCPRCLTVLKEAQSI